MFFVVVFFSYKIIIKKDSFIHFVLSSLKVVC